MSSTPTSRTGEDEDRKPSNLTSASHHIHRNKRLRSQCSVTPWQDFFEFDCVKHALLGSTTLLQEANNGQEQVSNTQMTLEEGLDRFSMWKARSSRLPHAVESTASLAQVVWRDKVAAGSCSSTELRLAYASAVLRSINGLADVLQQQRFMATSVANLCSQLGIPAWLVDVRHESTHNQLPTLPVLRMAAKTLLTYFREVYWEPISKRVFEDIDEATRLLKVYHEAVQKESGVRVKSAESVEDEMDDDDDDDDDDDSSSSSDDDDDEERVSWLGTATNSFAALQATKSSKGKETKSEPTSGRAKPVKKRKKPSDPNNPSLSILARDFVKLKLPFEVSRYALLSFLIWTGVDGSGGVLLSSIGEQQGTTKKDFDQLRLHYAPLLQRTCRAWPGFLCGLLMHLVDAVLSVEESTDSSLDEVSKRKLFFLEHWVRFLFTRRFLVHAFPRNLNIRKAKGSSQMSLVVLQSLNVPLNSLCDRCEESCLNDDSPLPRNSTSQILAHFFLSFLGKERHKDHGAQVLLTSPQECATKTNDGAEEAEATFGMSLEDMEKMLANPGGFQIVSNEPAKENPKTRGDESNQESSKEAIVRRSWTRCQSWDPCSIGSLPGFPM